MTTARIAGSWKITDMRVEGENISVTSEDALSGFLLKGALKDKQKDSTDAVLTADDSAGIKMAATFISAFGRGLLVFNANKTFKFSMPQMTKAETGTWSFNEKLQTLNMIPVKTKKAPKGIVKDAKAFKFIDGQLLMQMESDKEEGFLLTKRK